MNRFPQRFRFSFIKNGETTTCKYPPEQWNDNVINWDRDKNSSGILTKYTTSFKFVKEDADYLRACFNASGVFSKVVFTVEEYDYNLFEYKSYYQGNVDFYSYEEDEFSVSVSTLNIGYKVAFDANFDTQYEIDLPYVPPIVRYDRINLLNKVGYQCSMDRNDTNGDNYFINCTNIVNDVKSSDIEIALFVSQKLSTIWDEGSWLLKVNKDTSLKFKIDYDVSTSSNVRIILRFVIVRGGNKIYQDIDGNALSTSSHFNQNSFNGEKEINLFLQKGDLFYFELNETTGPIRKGIIKITASIDISYKTRNGSVDIPGISPFELLKELVKKATNNRYNSIVSKQLINSEVGYMVITSGDLIRGIKGGKIRTSLKDFFQAFKSMFGTGYAFEVVEGMEVLVVEHVNYFYNKSKSLVEVSEINKRSMKIDNNKIYNRLKIGYEDNTYDEINGKYEFNTKLEFSIDTDASSKELDLVSPYRADMYGIEFTIIDYEPKETTDSENDNDVFIIHRGGLIEGLGNTYGLDRSYQVLNDSAAGNTAFNVFLSPKRCLLRQIEYIKSLFAFSGDVLRFASAEKDYDMRSTGNVIEHADVDLSGYSVLFKPILHEFETMVPGNISEFINSNYNGYVVVRDRDKVIKGFIESLKENPGRNKSQTWKLIDAAI